MNAIEEARRKVRERRELEARLFEEEERRRLALERSSSSGGVSSCLAFLTTMLCCAGGGNRLANKASGDTSMTGKNTSGGSGNTLLQTSDGGNGDNKSKSTATSTAASSGGGNSSSSGGTAGANAAGNNKDGTAGSPEKKGPLVLGRFEVIPGRKGLLGEGSFSVVQKGIDKKTGATVAVKTYKHASQPDEIENCVTKFNRQIQVLLLILNKKGTKYDFHRRSKDDDVETCNPEGPVGNVFGHLHFLLSLRL